MAGLRMLIAALMIIGVAQAMDNVMPTKSQDDLVWSYNTGEIIGSSSVGVSITSDGSYVAAYRSDDKNLYLFSHDGKKLWNVSIDIDSLAMSADSSYIAVGSMDRMIDKVSLFNRDGKKLWSYETGSGLDSRIMSIAISSDGSYVAAGSYDNNLYLFNRDGKNLWSYKANPKDIAISADGSYVAAGSYDGKVYLFNRQGEILWSYETVSWINSIAWPNDDDINCITITADGSYVAAGSRNNNIYLFNRNGVKLWNYNAGDFINTISLSADGTYLAAGSYNAKVYLFDRDGNKLWNYKAIDGVSKVTISDDGSYIGAATFGSSYDSNRESYIFNRNGTKIWIFKSSHSAISVDGSFVAAGNVDGKVYLFERDFAPSQTINLGFTDDTNWVFIGAVVLVLSSSIFFVRKKNQRRSDEKTIQSPLKSISNKQSIDSDSARIFSSLSVQKVESHLDAGYILSKKASSLFNKKDYDSALETYVEAMNKFSMALENARDDPSLAKSINNNIISSRKNILASRFALGISVSEEGKSAFGEEKCEDAKHLYNKALEHFETSLQDAKELEDTDEIEKMQALINETKSNINSCYIASDKIKVEEFSEQAGNLIKEAVKFREDMELSKSRNNLKKAESVIEEAFDIATKRGFDEAQQILNRFLKNVREERNTVDDLQLKPVERVKLDKRDTSKVMSSKPDIKSPTEKRPLESDDLEITRGYEVLENKDMRFGILVTNRSNYTVNDVDVHLKYDRSLFSLKGKEVISLGNITKNNPKTATYFLTPLVGCVHNSKIRAIVSYRDASDNSLTVQMRPKEVHCISPFLAEKPMTEEQFSKLYESHSCHVDGIVFKGISADAVSNFIVDSAKNKRFVVKNSFINGTHIIYLSSVAKDKTFYLITVIIRSKNGQTHVGLRACSNNEGGINNFINEILTSLRHYMNSDQSAREVENVINNISVQIINSEVHGGVSIGGDAFGRDESFNQGSRR